MLASSVSFRVPVPLSDEVFVYERLPGRAFEPGDDVDAAFAHLHREGLEQEIPGAVAELRRRLDSRPGQ